MECWEGVGGSVWIAGGNRRKRFLQHKHPQREGCMHSSTETLADQEDGVKRDTS